MEYIDIKARVYTRDGTEIGIATDDIYQTYLSDIEGGPIEGFVKGDKYGFPDTIIYMDE